MFYMILTYSALIIAAYILGSIPSSVWIGKIFYKTDVREHGSHNAGTTNTLRVLGRKAALPVFLMDGGKGYAAVMLSNIMAHNFPETFGGESESFIIFRILLIAAAILGHIFPVFAGFRGGKGVATITGCLLAFSPIPIILSFTVFIIVLAWKHYVSLGSMAGAVMLPIFTILTPLISKMFFLKDWLGINDRISTSMIIFSFFIAGALITMHRKNIKRLKEGTESKVFLFINRK